MRRNHGRRRGLLLVAIAVMLVALLFFFEWLGSERPQKWVETPIALPPTDGGIAKRR